MHDISVIIPTYNVEKYIEESILSVIKQDFTGSFELLVIDDCSTDSTVSKVKDLMTRYPDINIKFLQQETNMRQGTARNRGLREALGKYVIFLDGDDILDEKMFKKTFEKAEEENFDFVICDWSYYYEDKGLVYVNNELFMNIDKLEGAECEKLLAAASFFTVNKLYNKNFLLENGIFYGEGYIYEDVEFYVDVAQKASKIGIIQNPLYKVRVSNSSTTKTNTASSEHVLSFIYAIQATMDKFNPKAKFSTYFLYRYLVTKALNYTKYRAPSKYRKSTMKKVLQLLNRSEYSVPSKLSPFYDFLFTRKLVQRENYNKIIFLHNIHSNKHLKLLILLMYKLMIYLWKVKNKFKANKSRYILKKKREKWASLPIQKDLILFLGFDYRYVGNSKYLFDFMVQNGEFEIYFVTNDENVSEKYRVAPRTDKFYEKLAKAKVVITESWVPLDFMKKDGQKWIQLWHGTPFKKLLFDSHEKYIMQKNPNHKRNKRKDIARWDLLLADSTVAVEKFKSSFAYDEEKIINYGYPRVQWLKDNKDNEILKNKIREKIGICSNKKVILYVPTWRDYNFRQNGFDLTYALDLKKLKLELSDEYLIINKDHSLSKNTIVNSEIINPPHDLEVQNLILISDIVISDYSSIIFDALAINKKFYLYINDYDKFKDARGVYEDIYYDLKPYISSDFDELINMMRSQEQENHQQLLYKYSSQEDMNSYKRIYDKISDFSKDREL